jgi:HTH-type transcriptional regulator/antitoxin HipB
MRVHSMSDIAAAIRGCRLDQKLSQSELARRSHVSRKWISEIEAGKPTAELALVLRVFEELELNLYIGEETSANAPPAAETISVPPGAQVDLDALLANHRNR